jgi:hypothetical protein
VLLSSGRSGGGGSPGKKPLQYLLHALSINTSIGIAQRRRISANPELLGSSSLHYTTRGDGGNLVYGEAAAAGSAGEPTQKQRSRCGGIRKRELAPPWRRIVS